VGGEPLLWLNNDVSLSVEAAQCEGSCFFSEHPVSWFSRAAIETPVKKRGIGAGPCHSPRVVQSSLCTSGHPYRKIMELWTITQCSITETPQNWKTQ
jgi:hypothetical protein